MDRINNFCDVYELIASKISGIFLKPIYSYLVVIIYKFILDVIYCTGIGGYSTFFYVEISIPNIINGWLAICIMAIFIRMYCKQNTPSSVLMTILNMIYFIPIITYCSFGGGSSVFFICALTYWGLLSILQIKVPFVKYKFQKTGKLNVSNYLFYAITAIFSIISIFIWVKYSDFRLVTNLLDVYEVRLEAAKCTLPGILSYIRQLSNIVIPLLMLLALIKRKYLFIILFLFITLINFSYAGDKSVILFPIAIIGGYVFFRKDMSSLIFPAGIILEVVALCEKFIGVNYITSFLFRRQGLVLAQLSELYYRFFSDGSIDLYRNSFLGKLGFESIYKLPISKVIGNNFETQIVNCNNGLLADVWANLGLIGIVIMPIILIICFRLFDLVAYGVNPRVTVCLSLYYAIYFANTTWSTVLLTHGFLIMCILLLIFPRNDIRKVNYENYRGYI